MAFRKLIRFVDTEGVTQFGDLGDRAANELAANDEIETLSGDISRGFQKTGEARKLDKLLCPLPEVPLVVCIGLNYRQHAEEAKLNIPLMPVVFTKPPDALAGPIEDIHVHPDTQAMLDYEGELTVIIGKDAKNVSEADSLNYVLGYTAGNDVSARNYQLPDKSGGQFCYAKSFDGFAPIGPCIASAAEVSNPQDLQLTTRVNGEMRQQSRTSDMIFTVAQIISHLSRGTTLRKGTAIQTGTPSGVGLFMSPKGFLKNGDVVEVEVEKIGAIKNKMVFD